ncbi:MAG: hypothetical protein HUJ51_02005, partial [Eggerthellaceae bacterium]|nr:hypothetical protein [Eggerthellaceae bacterium]
FREMVELACLDIVDKGITTGRISLVVAYKREVYGQIPSIARSHKLPGNTDSFKELWEYFCELWEASVLEDKSIRRINLNLGNLLPRELTTFSLFANEEELEVEHKLDKTFIDIKKKFGKNAVLYAYSLKEEATMQDRNRQVGGHRA